MTIRLSRVHQSCKTKKWWQNMDNRTRNYWHIGEEFYIRTLHMNQKCKMDRVTYY